MALGSAKGGANRAAPVASGGNDSREAGESSWAVAIRRVASGSSSGGETSEVGARFKSGEERGAGATAENASGSSASIAGNSARCPGVPAAWGFGGAAAGTAGADTAGAGSAGAGAGPSVPASAVSLAGGTLAEAGSGGSRAPSPPPGSSSDQTHRPASDTPRTSATHSPALTVFDSEDRRDAENTVSADTRLTVSPTRKARGSEVSLAAPATPVRERSRGFGGLEVVLEGVV
jgi:hypothetical protein